MGLMKTVNENIYRFRKQRGFTQRELGDKCQIDISTINRLETKDNADPQLSSLELIATALNVRVIDLFDESIIHNEAAIKSLTRPQYRTFSEWFWKKFYSTIGEWENLDDESKMRIRFEKFLNAVEDRDIPMEERESLWNERFRFRPSIRFD